MQTPGSMPQFYAHTSNLADGKTPNSDESTWEPLFTPFGKDDENCQGKDGASCQSCHDMKPQHGHLNKVAFWAGKFAAEMFPEGEERETARQWGYLAGLRHDSSSRGPTNYINLETPRLKSLGESCLIHIIDFNPHTPCEGRKKTKLINPCPHLMHSNQLTEQFASFADIPRKLQSFMSLT